MNSICHPLVIQGFNHIPLKAGCLAGHSAPCIPRPGDRFLQDLLDSFTVHLHANMAKSLYVPPTKMSSVLQGRSSRLQLYISFVALLLTCWMLTGPCNNCERLSQDYRTNERQTHEATRFTPSIGSGILAVYGSGSSFKNKLASYLPGKKTSTINDRPQYSLKPIAYIFPQFHPIPENDKFWGKGFTEWTNVNKTKINKAGIEPLHPAEDVGYYNLLDLSTRQRYTQLLRNSR